MRWIEWLAESLMIPIWLAGEWLGECRGWFHRWQTAERGGAVPGDVLSGVVDMIERGVNDALRID